MKLYDLETERAALGAMIISKEALCDSIETLTPQDFYFTKHQLIFKAIKELFNNNINADYLAIRNILEKEGTLSKVGENYIIELVASVPCVENIEYYNTVIKEKSYQRTVYGILENIRNDKMSLDEGVTKIENLSRNEVKEESFSAILENTLRDSMAGVKHRFRKETLAHYLGGVDNGELITVGGYTSQGKSTFGIQLAIDFAQDGKKVLYLSSEMSEIEVGRRILSNLNKKNIMDFRKGRFEEGEKEAFENIIEIISKISGKWEMNIRKVYNVSDICRYVRKYNPEIVFVDYLQNLEADHNYSDYQKATYNIKELQKLALAQNITIFALSQLSRTKEVRKPKLADLRDSGRIEECSNIVILLYWENRLKEKVEQRMGGEPPEVLEVGIAKNRDGTIGRTYLDFYPEYCRLEDTNYEYKEYTE